MTSCSTIFRPSNFILRTVDRDLMSLIQSLLPRDPFTTQTCQTLGDVDTQPTSEFQLQDGIFHHENAFMFQVASLDPQFSNNVMIPSSLTILAKLKPGLLQPLSTLSLPWSTVSLDFIVKPPSSNECTVVLVAIEL